MSITKDQILETVAAMSVTEVIELVSAMEEKFGVSATTPVSTLASVDTDSSEKEEKTEFDIILKNIGANKVSVIKTVRSITGLGLKEAKDLVESAPVSIKENIKKDDAESLKKTLEEAGAEIEIR